MGQVTRRGLLRAGAGIAAGTALAGGPLQGFVALAAGAPRTQPDRNALGPVPDLRDGQVRLHLPEGFQYRSFHDTEVPGGVTLDDGTLLPGRHDGMAAFQSRRGNVVLVRNHEVNGPVAAAFGPGVPYDNRTGGGTTTIEVTRFGEVVKRVHEPQRHADELLRRPHAVGQLDHVRGDRQRPGRRRRLHGRLERDARAAARLAVRGAGEHRHDRRPVVAPADPQGRTLRPRGRRLRPARQPPVPDRGQLRLPVGAVPLSPADGPDAHRLPR